MGKLEEEIRQIIEERYGNLSAFAKTVPVPYQTINSALKHSLTDSSMATVMPIAKALGLDPFQLAAGKAVQMECKRTAVDVPLFGTIAAGKPVEPSEADDVFPIPAKLHDAYPRSFMLRVEGSSMDRVLPDGCYALVDPCPTVDYPGDPYAVIVGDGNATVKRVKPLNNGVMLEPDSHDATYHPIVFDYADPDAETLRIIGHIVWHCAALHK